jgi:hypothetical protein
MQFFQDLGSLVEHRWRDQNYNEEVFPEIAAEALAEANPSKQVNPWDIIRWLNNTTQLPEQRDVDGKFGNPPITLYDGPRFFIDVYYWLDGTTSIHQHAFCGAFQVLLGSSILSRYGFEEKRRINPHFLVGQIILNKVELLEEEDVRQILPGRQYMHSLFHLNRPSATIIIRTRQSVSGLPQYHYLKPYFAIDPFLKPTATIKKVQSASLLLSIKHPEADDVIGELLSCSDFHTAFAVIDLAFDHLTNDPLEKAFGLSAGQERFGALLEIARRRHGELVNLILPVIEEARRQQNLSYRRGQITSSEHRFFLALLLNVPDRMKVLDLVMQRFPGQNPVDTVLDWIEELGNTRSAGSSESNVLGIANVDDEYLFVFQCLLEGRTMEQTKEAFVEAFSVDNAVDPGDKLEALYNTIRNSLPFKSIFLGSPPAMRSKTNDDSLLPAAGRKPSKKPEKARQKAGSSKVQAPATSRS